jgi:hypothetical protein
MGVFVLLFLMAARNYLEPYGTATGQLVLCVVVACWALGVWAMARLGRRSPVERFLAQKIDTMARPVTPRQSNGGADDTAATTPGTIGS